MTTELAAQNRDVAMGELRGRVASLEERVTRFEVQAEKRLQAIDAKLDAIAEMLAGWTGARKLATAIVAIGVGAAGWLFHVVVPNFPK